ncbi:MAG: hypothetical protein JWO37_408 [Acidimicrobiales bacterium]|jgi:hypothetical protein|nr:hypothetical protein [Acidimicrobiales bacterium]
MIQYDLMLTEGMSTAEYDRLTAAQVLGLIDQLSRRELAALAGHERATKARVTVLRRLDRLTAEPDTGPEPSVEPVIGRDADPSGTCLLCERAIASFSGFAGHLSKHHGLAPDPGFESSLPSMLFSLNTDASPRSQAATLSSVEKDTVVDLTFEPQETVRGPSEDSSYDFVATDMGQLVSTSTPPARRSGLLRVGRRARRLRQELT